MEDVTKKHNIHIKGNKDASQTLVFGHGFGTDQTSFHKVITPFEQDYKIVLYDNVGGGQSDVDAFSPLRYSSLNGYVTDLIDIFKQLALKDVIYI